MTINADEVLPDDFAFVYLDVDSPPIAWLAYRGLLNSPDDVNQPSWFLMDVVKRGLVSTIRREGWLEGARRQLYSERLSRMRSIYAFPTLDEAKRSNAGQGKFRGENLVSIAPLDKNFRCEIYDTRWIDDFDALGDSRNTAVRYWSGESYPRDPLREALLSGRFAILGTTVRKRAYETIKRRDPKFLAFLELARLAAHFGSDLGKISPFIVEDERGLVVTDIIKYDEESGVDIFKKTLEEAGKNPGFLVNWADLEPLTGPKDNPTLDERFRAPDFRHLEREFRIEKATELYEAIEQAMRAY